MAQMDISGKGSFETIIICLDISTQTITTVAKMCKLLNTGIAKDKEETLYILQKMKEEIDLGMEQIDIMIKANKMSDKL